MKRGRCREKGQNGCKLCAQGRMQELSGLIEEARARVPHLCIYIPFSFALSFREYPVVSVHIRLLRTHDEFYKRA